MALMNLADGDLLSLDIGLDDPTFGRLIETQERFLGLIREVARDVAGNAGDVRWVVASVADDDDRQGASESQ